MNNKNVKKRFMSNRHFNRLVKQKTNDIWSVINLQGTSTENNTVNNSFTISDEVPQTDNLNTITEVENVNLNYNMDITDDTSVTYELNVSENASNEISPKFVNTTDQGATDTLFDANIQLRNWAVEYKIPHLALSDLLKILSQTSSFSTLPKDARTFLKTPREVISRTVDPGQYYHAGIQNSINMLFNNHIFSNPPKLIEIAINIDGVPISKSSGSQLYPILGIVLNCNISNNVVVFGVYHGYEKPADFNSFLEDFVNEAVTLTQNGIYVHEQLTKFKIKMYLFDAVAKASVLYIKGHSGYSSCTKCMQEGEYLQGRICFPNLIFKKRTHNDFINKVDSDHHVGTTILEKVPDINLITEVPLDYMHLICLGVVKKFLVLTWCFGAPPHKLQSSKIKEMSKLSESLAKFMPCEFARKPRSLQESKRWKATELRMFLLYTCPLILKPCLSKQRFIHFLTLHVAISLLLNDKKIHDFLDYAESLLQHFVQSTKMIYGSHFLSHNIHNLLHLADDVRNFRNLNKFSNFSSENYLQHLKSLIRKPDNVLPQIVRRISEINVNKIEPSEHKSLNNCKYLFGQKHTGILIQDCSDPQYKSVRFSNFKISLLKQDCCCLLNNELIVEIKNIAYCHKIIDYVIIGHSYKSKFDLYKQPCVSSMLGIYVVADIDTELSYWPLKNISSKLIRFEENNRIVVFPLLHI